MCLYCLKRKNRSFNAPIVRSLMVARSNGVETVISEKNTIYTYLLDVQPFLRYRKTVKKRFR